MPLIDKIKPSDFDTTVAYMGTPFQNCEKEIVARNIVIVCQSRSDEWQPFKWEDYSEGCSHLKGADSWRERIVLSELASAGYLDRTDGGYQVNDKFLGAIVKFVK